MSVQSEPTPAEMHAFDWRRYGPRLALIALTILLLLGFRSVNANVTSAANLYNLLVQTSYLMIFASAQAIVLITRGYDLSLGNTVSLVSVVAALSMTAGVAQWDLPAILLGAGCGLAVAMGIGGVNGFLVAVVRLNPFIATFATMSIALALSSTISGGFPVAGLPAAFGVLATATPLGVPIQIWFMVGTLVVLHLMLTRTVFGRALYLIGANPVAARVAGVRVRLHLTVAYVTCSLMAGFGTILLTARLGSGEPTVGGTLTLEAIAAAVLGGISTKGAEGDMLAPLLGAFFITVLSNGMNLVQIDGYVQQMTLGVIIIISLALDRLRSH